MTDTTDRKFWIAIWAMFTIVLIMFMSMMLRYSMSADDVRMAMIKHGVEPLMVNCVLNDVNNRAPKCLVLAKRNLKQSER